MQKLFENWRNYISTLGALDDSERVNTSVGATHGEDEPESEEKDISALKILIFGHSQTSQYRVGGAQMDKLVSLGIPSENIKLVVKSGRNDEELLGEITGIKGTFTHAILHLDGNSTKVIGCSLRGKDRLRDLSKCSADGPVRFEGEKTGIINYVKDSLNVPEKNILIFTPPVNSQYGKGGRLFGRPGRKIGRKSYKIRGIGHQRAINFFRASFSEATVPDLIYADDSAFSDGLHMRKSAAKEAANIATKFIGL